MKSQSTSKVFFGGIRFPRKRKPHHQKDGTRPPEAGEPNEHLRLCVAELPAARSMVMMRITRVRSPSKHHPPSATIPIVRCA